MAADIRARGQEEDEDGPAGDAAVPPAAAMGDAGAPKGEVSSKPETVTDDSPAPPLSENLPGKSSRQHESKAVTTVAPSPTMTPRAATRRDDGSGTEDGGTAISPPAVSKSGQSSQSAVLSANDAGAASANRKGGAGDTAVGVRKSGTREDDVGVGVSAAVGGVDGGGDRKESQNASSKKTTSEEHRQASKDVNAETQDGIVELLETAASHTVDCLLFIRW